MELKIEYEGTHATFLDLDISVVNNRFVELLQKMLKQGGDCQIVIKQI